MINVLYLQTLYPKNVNALRGRKLYERFQRDSEECILSYMVSTNMNEEEHESINDVLTYEEIDELDPDLIFLEGGLMAGDLWRIPEEIIIKFVSKGTIVIICDVDWNILNQQRIQYKQLLDFCRVSIAYDDLEPVMLYDTKNHYRSEHSIVCNHDDIAFEKWLAPIYDGLPKFVVGLPVPMRSWSELVATCNQSTTYKESNLEGIIFGEPASSPFASMTRLGLGYIVLITGNVTSDVWMDEFPGNIEWLTRLAYHLIERVRIDRRLNKTSQQVFISHCHRNKDYAKPLNDELIRRGFGTWIDERKLIVGDDLTPEIRHAIENCTHYMLIWSEECLDSDWIGFELKYALDSGKRMFIIRLDEASVPDIVSDKLRIEAQGIKASEVAKTIAYHLEREERHSSRDN